MGGTRSQSHGEHQDSEDEDDRKEEEETDKVTPASPLSALNVHASLYRPIPTCFAGMLAHGSVQTTFEKERVTIR